MRQQAIVFLDEKLLAQALLHIGPILIDCLILVCGLWVGSLDLVILSQELLELVGIETASLTVHERSGEKHLVGALVEHVLHLAVSDSETELVALFLDNLILH